MGCFDDWTKLYSEAFRCLRPGGWLEHTDFSVYIKCDDGSIPQDSIYATWNAFFSEASEKTGKDFTITVGGKNLGWMREAGFTGSAHVKDFKLPLGTWPAEKKWKEVGAFNMVTCDEGLEGYILYLGTKVLNWTLEDIHDMLDRTRTAMRNPRYHAYYPW